MSETIYKLLKDTTIAGVIYEAGGVLTSAQTQGHAAYLTQTGAVIEIAPAKPTTQTKKD